ncbi:hypothetical protein protein (plasmid) [Bacillus cereus G9241]|nr:hypothetical protein protein [Bacillus cereus G9241]
MKVIYTIAPNNIEQAPGKLCISCISFFGSFAPNIEAACSNWSLNAPTNPKILINRYTLAIQKNSKWKAVNVIAVRIAVSSTTLLIYKATTISIFVSPDEENLNVSNNKPHANAIASTITISFPVLIPAKYVIPIPTIKNSKCHIFFVFLYFKSVNTFRDIYPSSIPIAYILIIFSPYFFLF